MKCMKSGILILSMVLAVVFSLINVKLASAAFNQNRIIDDAIFNNAGSMSATDIDTWLNKFPNSCISTNNGFSAPEPTGYSPSTNFTYGANTSAGKVIYDVSKVYGLNPQVILSTLQKEQSLVTGSTGCHPNTPDSSNTFQCNLWGQGNIPCTSACPYSGGCIPIALGNNCPGNCQASSEGFSKQIVGAAWKLKFWQQRSEGNIGWDVQVRNFPYAGDTWDNSDDPQTCYDGLRMTEGYFQLCPNGSFAQYDGLSTVHQYSGGPAVTVELENGATAALYNWTPFLSGNQNFVSIFEGWFGSTTNVCGNDPGTYPNSGSKASGDYNGDGKSDVSVYRPSDSCWHVRAYGDVQFGQTNDIPVPGDYNGDGKTDIAVFRPSSGDWHIRGVGDYIGYGQSGDVPVPGDYNGDGKTDAAVYRPAQVVNNEIMWHIRGVGDFAYGHPGDIPVPGDYNGDGKTDIAVFRPSDGMWHIRAFGDFSYGQSNDIPVPGDYNGDGKTDIAVFRPSQCPGGECYWHIRGVGDFQYGHTTDIPDPGDYNGDRKTNIAVFRPSDGMWHIRGVGDYSYGGSGDVPIAGGTLNAYLLQSFGLISSY